MPVPLANLALDIRLRNYLAACAGSDELAEQEELRQQFDKMRADMLDSMPDERANGGQSSNQSLGDCSPKPSQARTAHYPPMYSVVKKRNVELLAEMLAVSLAPLSCYS